MFLPRRSLWRSVSYFAKRLVRVQGQPHAIAAGFAAGAAVSFLPFMGLHFLLGALLALLSRGSLLASALGTAVGNPLTFPLIWTTSYWIGTAILGSEVAVPDSAVTEVAENSGETGFAAFWGPVLKPMIAGGTLLGVVAWVVFYFTIYHAVSAAQDRRRRMLRSAQEMRAPAE